VAGFVGSHLVEQLLGAGHRVTGIDNFSRGSREYLAAASQTPAFTLLEADLADGIQSLAAFTKAHRQQPVDTVWHMAANSDIAAGVADPSIDLRDTFLTTFYTVRSMRELGIPAIAFASTSAIYGESRTILTEDFGPLFPISNYGAMKLASEGLLSAALESHLQRVWIFRFPNVIGGRATHGVIYDLLRQLRATPGEALSVLGDGTQQKPYLHVSDLVDAMLLIVERAPAALSYYNISGTDDGATVRCIAETVVEVAAPGTPIRYTGVKRGWVGDIPSFRYSTEKLSALGWKPRLSSQEAVRQAVSEVWAQLNSCSSLS